MNIALWILQVLLALHTLMGALWKFSNPAEQSVPSLKAIPQVAWLGISVLEIICSLVLLAPFVYKPAGRLVPFAAAFIGAVMLLYCGLHLASGEPNKSPMIYWAAVLGLSAFLAYARRKLRPHAA